MKASQAVEAIMKKVGLTKKTLAEKMCSADKSCNTRLVNDRLHQNDITVGKLDEMVRAMGYKIVIVPDTPENTDVLKDMGAYRIF